MKIAVITGASSGMGREFVLRLDAAHEYDEIWAIARRQERLEELEGLTRATLRAIPLDLTDAGSLDIYRRLLDAREPEIVTLVNAAGYGKFEPYNEVSLDDAMGIIDLNCKALIAVTHMSLPYMGYGAEVYNLGSLSSFQPVPYMLNYASSKALVVSYSRGLNVELASRGIRVMAVCPGWVRTEFFTRAQEKNKSAVNYFNKVYEPADVVKTALADMARGRDLSIHGLPVKLQVLAVKLLPHSLVMKIWLRQQSKGIK